MSTPGYFPFGAVPALSQPPVTYDIVMAKNFPRVSFVPTESGGIYQELVEVNGDLWFVTNATWDVNKLGFYQSSGTLTNCNFNQNAYAWVQKGVAGDAIRMYGAMTGNANTAVIWVPIFDAAPKGTVISPLPLTQTGSAALTVNTTFNSSTAGPVSAFAINVQNVASAQSSALEQFTVNGVPVWLVDINGVLQIGQINPGQLNPPVYMSLTAGVGIAPIGLPPSATIGLSHDDYVDLPNDQTITGVKTIPSTSRIMLGDGDGNIQGGPDDGVYLVSGAKIATFGGAPPASFTAIAESPTAMILAGKQEFNNQMLTVYINTGLTVGTTFTPQVAAFFDNSGNLTVSNDLNVGGALAVTAGVQITGPLTVSGTTTLNGNLVLAGPAVQGLMNYFEGNLNFDYTGESGGHAGLKIKYDAANTAIEIDTSCLMYIGVGTGSGGSGIISSDGSVNITKQMNTDQKVDLAVDSSVKGSSVKLYHGTSTPLTKGIIQCGQQVINMGSAAGGANNSAHGNATVSLPINYPNSYDVAIAQTGGDWAICKITAGSKTAGGFEIQASTPWNTATGPGADITVDWIAAGN